MRLTKLFDLWIQLLPVILLAAALQAHSAHDSPRQLLQGESSLEAGSTLHTVNFQHLKKERKSYLNQWATTTNQFTWPAHIGAATELSPEPLPPDPWPARGKLNSHWHLIVYQHFKASLA